jgi:NTP pyrophosphatase (non-canonical NTP hydrolase)
MLICTKAGVASEAEFKELLKMDMKEFQNQTLSTAVYYDKGERTMAAFNYCVVGLCGEAGELANKWKKVLREDPRKGEASEYYAGLRKELQDVLWYVARAMDELGADMGFEAEELLLRIADRKSRDVIKGSGDNR